MPDLLQSLQGRDLGYLHIVAASWGVEFSASDAHSGLEKLIPRLLDRNLLHIVLQDLSSESRRAFYDLVQNGGRLPWIRFSRLNGAIREMGPARRDRELPHLNPHSATEELWYRGLLSRSFFDAQDGLQEYAYIPSDILDLIAENTQKAPETLGRIASSAEKGKIKQANDQIIDHACTLLGGLRSGQLLEAAFDVDLAAWTPLKVYLSFLKQILSCANILDSTGIPDPEATKGFLEKDRSESLIFLVNTWMNSTKMNDFLLTPGLIFEGVWENDPLQTRRKIIELIKMAPQQKEIINFFPDEARTQKPNPRIDQNFVSLESFSQAVKQSQPDYQRPAGDYDTWFIKSVDSGEYLRGFQHWDAVDGLFLNFIICGPMHWLGLIDLAMPVENPAEAVSEISAFRFSSYAAKLLKGEAPFPTPSEDGQWLVRSDGLIIVPRLSSRTARYQIARFTNLESIKGKDYHYRVTPASLERARYQGLNVAQLLVILKRQTRGLPPPFVSALERWESQGKSVILEKAIILRVKTPDILKTLQSSRGSRFLGDQLGPTTIIILPGAVESICKVMSELGFLTDIKFE